MIKYIVYKRFNAIAICGAVDIPVGTECVAENGIIIMGGQQLCSIFSENAHQYFAINDDEQGLIRGNLTSLIINNLTIEDEKYQERWDIVWNDDICQKYKRIEHADHWLWNHRFYNAPIEDLEYIIEIISAISNLENVQDNTEQELQ